MEKIAWIALLIGIYPVGFLVVGFVCGAILDWFGRKLRKR